jgi:hypothetical protein
MRFYKSQSADLLDLVSRRYGQRPSSLLPSDTFDNEWESLQFDINVALRGMLNEYKAQNKQPPGQITNRNQAMAAMQRARQDVAEMEAAATKH